MKNKPFKLFLCLLLVFSIPLSLLSCNKKKSGELTTVRLNEVVRSVFYAPMYVSINKGFFKEQGIDIDLSTGQGADKTMQQLLSKSVDIGFCGPEQVIYIYNQKREDYPVVFAQLTQKDGSFLVGKKEDKNFKWEDLKGKTVIGGRPGGMPEMALEYVMKNHGITPGAGTEVITNLAFTATGGAFKSGSADYVALFEPTASMLEKENGGAIVASVGASAGTLPYTCFFSTKSYIEKNPALIESFTKAIYKGQKWVQSANEKDIAKEIKSFFPGTDEELLMNVIKNYKSIDAFAKTPEIKEGDMNRLMDIIQGYKADLIPQRPSFDKIVTNKYAKEAIQALK